jgi:hypothetical protein
MSWMLSLGLAIAAPPVPLTVAARTIDGRPVAGAADIQVAWYATDVSPTPLSTVTVAGAPVADGKATVLVTPPIEVTSGTLWWQATIGGHVLGPRERLMALPVAHQIERVPALATPPWSCTTDRYGTLYLDTTTSRLQMCVSAGSWTEL